jgi:hypothetical protein
MTECDDSQSSGSTVPVAVAKKKSTDALDVVVNEDGVSEPTCVPECGSVSELINDTMEQLCMVDQDDSRGPSEATTGARGDGSDMLPQKQSKSSTGGFLSNGKVWQKRGRFTIWPVSLGDDRHV